MKTWGELTINQKVELQEQFNELWMSGNYNMSEIMVMLDITSDVATTLYRRFEFKGFLACPRNKVFEELTKERGSI